MYHWENLVGTGYTILSNLRTIDCRNPWYCCRPFGKEIKKLIAGKKLKNSKSRNVIHVLNCNNSVELYMVFNNLFQNEEKGDFFYTLFYPLIMKHVYA